MMHKRALGTTAVLFFAAAFFAGCSGLGGGGAVPNALDREDALPASASATGTAVFKIVVPAHPTGTTAQYTSPGTQGVAVVMTRAGSTKVLTRFFFALTSKEKYCKGGAPAALTCVLAATVPSGKDAFAISAVAGTKAKSAVLARQTITATIKPHKKTTIALSMGGAVAFLAAVAENPFPATGAAAMIPIDLVAADAEGYLILGAYDEPIVVSSSDKTGAIKLSAATLASSVSASSLSVKYSGKSLAKGAAIELSAGKHGPSAKAVILPGGSGIVSSPSIVLASFDSDAVLVSLSGPGTIAPYTLASTQDASHDPACGTLADISGGGSDFAVAPSQKPGLCWLAAADAQGHTGSVPVLVSSFAWGYTPSTPPPVTIPTASPFTASSTASIPVPSAPPAGQTPQPISLTVPAAGGFTGAFQLPIGSVSAIPPQTSVVTSLSSVLPGSLPIPEARRRPRTGATVTPILYLGLSFSNTVTLANQPSVALTLPNGYVVGGASYWLALYDPTRPDLGWELGFEGPGAVSGSTVTFAGSSGVFTFQQFQTYYFSLYAQSIALPTPAPAPTQPPPTMTPTPGVTPTSVPSPGFAVDPATIAFTATGQTQAITAAGTAPYSVFTSDATVVTASPSSGAGPFTAMAQGAGTATLTIADSLGRTAFVTVSVTTTTIPVH
jgi:hypothetical protein